MSDQPDSPQLIKMGSPKRLFWTLAAIIFLVMLIVAVMGPPSGPPQWSLTEVAQAAKSGEIARMYVGSDDTLTITLRDGSQVTSAKDPSSTIQEQLTTLGVSPEQLARITWDNGGTANPTVLVIGVLIFIVPLIIIVVAIVWLSRRSAKKNAPQV